VASLCPDLELLAAYADDNVTSEERTQFEAHLNDCSRCLDVLSFVIASRVAIPDPPSPADKLQ